MAIKLGAKIRAKAYNKEGKLLWKAEGHNKLPNVGLDYVLDILLKNATRHDPWYVGLSGSDATNPADWTMANQGSTWTEITNYNETTRQEFIDDSISGHKVSNTTNKATFNINATVEVYGAFLANTSDKGGTSGLLLSIANFTGGAKSLSSGATLEIEYEMETQNSA